MENISFQFHLTRLPESCSLSPDAIRRISVQRVMRKIIFQYLMIMSNVLNSHKFSDRGNPQKAKLNPSL